MRDPQALASSGLDIVAQGRGLVFDRVDLVLHQVPDRDEGDQCLTIDHREVAATPLGHQRQGQRQGRAADAIARCVYLILTGDLFHLLDGGQVAAVRPAVEADALWVDIVAGAQVSDFTKADFDFLG